ncbi:hypothetical protein SDC9_175544 [bioreactor metagenome]|uniref:Uncharacterized protein n=1 Tax=bioreactor metagenome TaxID=1076179 RepID=A0A645GMZ5_9ZZZZ
MSKRRAIEQKGHPSFRKSRYRPVRTLGGQHLRQCDTGVVFDKLFQYAHIRNIVCFDIENTPLNFPNQFGIGHRF